MVGVPRVRDSWADEEDSDSSDRRWTAKRSLMRVPHEVRDDDDVWVYAGEERVRSLVLTADHQAPKIVEVTDDEMTITFSDWGETADSRTA